MIICTGVAVQVEASVKETDLWKKDCQGIWCYSVLIRENYFDVRNWAF